MKPVTRFTCSVSAGEPLAFKKACHALSVDDERKTFHPLLWDERDEDDRIEQVWFPGVHSDVGGGYARHNLALVSLDWMISKVEANPDTSRPGLYFIDQKRDEFLYQSDWNGAQHDSRSFLGAYYRYEPRDISNLCTATSDQWYIAKPKIHRSVFERISANVVPYAPTGIPDVYTVVSTRKPPADYETDDEKKIRMSKMQAALNVINQRKALYYVFLGISLVLLSAPLWYKLTGTSIELPIRLHSGLFDAVRLILPDFTAHWLNAWERTPTLFYGLVSLLLLFYGIKMFLHRKTQRLASEAWHTLRRSRDRIAPSPPIVYRAKMRRLKEKAI